MHCYMHLYSVDLRLKISNNVFPRNCISYEMLCYSPVFSRLTPKNLKQSFSPTEIIYPMNCNRHLYPVVSSRITPQNLQQCPRNCISYELHYSPAFSRLTLQNLQQFSYNLYCPYNCTLQLYSVVDVNVFPIVTTRYG